MIIVVPPEASGVRLDRYLTSQLGDRSRSQIQRLISEGRILIVGSRVKPNHALRIGERVAIEIPEPADSEVTAEPLPLAILYQDPDVIVVDKPAGMVVHPSAGHASGTL